MTLTQAEKLQLRNRVEQVLHVPGNYRGGILEMAMVLDCSMNKEVLEGLVKETAATLKRQGEVFRNVRVNILWWQGDQRFADAVTPMPFLLMGSCFAGYRPVPCRKALEFLTARLRLFYARSKLILVFTDGDYRIGDRAALEDTLRPFLYHKMIFLTAGGDGSVECARTHEMTESFREREEMP